MTRNDRTEPERADQPERAERAEGAERAEPPQRRRPGARWTALVIAIAVVAALIGGGTVGNQVRQGNWTAVEAAAPPADSALKGFIPFAPDPGQDPYVSSTALPYSMEWFYLPANAVVTGQDTYDWTQLDAWLDSIAGRGHQAVFRLYLDYPGRPSGVPQYLIDEGIDTSRTYTQYGNNNISFSPDYDDPRVSRMMLDLVTALGERYDGDPRIGFITQGLIGFWGEGHTYPQNGWEFPENWLAGSDTQHRVLDAWVASFSVTPTQVRYPDDYNADKPVGYHDDSFPWATLPTTDWHFLAKLEAAGASDTWQTQPIGGEIYPEIQSCLFNAPQNCPDQTAHEAEGRGYDMASAVTAAHPTWLVDQAAFSPGYQGDAVERATDAQASLGYTFRITQMSAGARMLGGLVVRARITNDGVAPFYYDWPAEIALLDDSGTPVTSTSVQLDLKGLLPGEETSLSGRLATGGLDNGPYRIALRVPNPVAGGTPVRFANAGQTAGPDGWVVIGTTGS